MTAGDKPKGRVVGTGTGTSMNGTTLEDVAAYVAEHPCPFCGGRDYEVNWVSLGPLSSDGRSAGTLTCLNPECPHRFGPELGQRWETSP